MAELPDNVIQRVEIPTLELPGLDCSPPRKPLPLQLGKWQHLRKPLRRLIKRATRNL
jgi:hypothetical protein